LNKDRADYGAQVYHRLARDTGASERKLHACTQVYRRIPIVHRGAQFNWAQVRVYCSVEDDSQRQALMKEAVGKAWTAPQLRERVSALNAAI
jgi:hypothetical protein